MISFANGRHWPQRSLRPIARYTVRVQTAPSRAALRTSDSLIALQTQTIMEPTYTIMRNIRNGILCTSEGLAAAAKIEAMIAIRVKRVARPRSARLIRQFGSGPFPRGQRRQRDFTDHRVTSP